MCRPSKVSTRLAMAKRSTVAKILPGAVITTVSQYLDYIQDACSNFTDPLFRGHREESWSLVPKIARLELRDNKDLLSTEQAMLTEFRGRALPHLEFQPRSNWEWLALAQHFGMATRLLDWTTNPLAALWFAIEGPSEGQSRAAVWIYRERVPVLHRLDESLSPHALYAPDRCTRRLVHGS